MEAVMNMVRKTGDKASAVAVKGVAFVLDSTAKGISTISSMVKGEKKLTIKIEDSK